MTEPMQVLADRVARRLVTDFLNDQECGKAASYDRLETEIAAALYAAMDYEAAVFLVSDPC